jgi:hypothetical protein
MFEIQLRVKNPRNDLNRWVAKLVCYENRVCYLELEKNVFHHTG